jgi:hypothetical protein
MEENFFEPEPLYLNTDEIDKIYLDIINTIYSTTKEIPLTSLDQLSNPIILNNIFNEMYIHKTHYHIYITI